MALSHSPQSRGYLNCGAGSSDIGCTDEISRLTFFIVIARLNAREPKAEVHRTDSTHRCRKPRFRKIAAVQVEQRWKALRF